MPAALLALAAGAFGIGTTEFIIMGLLTQVSQDLHISIPTAGTLISGYAVGVAVGAPVLTLASRRWPRKLLLLSLMLLFIAGNAAAALAPSYGWLLAARVLTSLTHGTFFGVGAVVHQHAGQLAGGEPGGAVDGHRAQRRDEGLGGGDGHPAHRDPVGRAEDQHPADHVAAQDELGIGAGGHRAGVDVARVGHDDGLGRVHDFGGHRAGQVARNLGVKTVGVGRVEQPGYGRYALGGLSHDFLFPRVRVDVFIIGRY